MNLERKKKEIAEKRFEIIKPILKDRGNLELIKQISEKNKISIATLYRWLKVYNETGLVSSLMGKKKGVKIGTTKLNKLQNDIINDTINSIYLTKTKHSIRKTFCEIQLKCKEMGVHPPHFNTIRNRIKNIPDEEIIRKRYGYEISSSLKLEKYFQFTVYQIGDLIHYQGVYDYLTVFKQPKNGKVYEVIGEILREWANYDLTLTLSTITQNSTFLKSYSENEHTEYIFHALEDFKVYQVIDLVSRMQGEHEDDLFLKYVDFIKERKNI